MLRHSMQSQGGEAPLPAPGLFFPGEGGAPRGAAVGGVAPAGGRAPHDVEVSLDLFRADGMTAGVAGVGPGAAVRGDERHREAAGDRARRGVRIDADDFAPAARVEWINRALNMCVASVALFLLAPLCVLVALAVKLTSRGPVFYTQTRVGLDRRWERAGSDDDDDRREEDLGGQPFTILKFRSMTVDAEQNGVEVWATKHDARITPVGHVLRKTRLDEIPQLINVLRGEMNIVGPRPERPSIVVRLRDHIETYPLRHRVKPGITGWAQINHSYDSCIEDVRTKVEYDLEYIASQGMWMDLKIMALTLPVMLFRRGAH